MAPHFPAISLAIVEIMSELSDDHYGGGEDDGGCGELDLLNLSSDEFPETRTSSLLAGGTYEEIRRHDLRTRNICYSIDMIQVSQENVAGTVANGR